MKCPTIAPRLCISVQEGATTRITDHLAWTPVAEISYTQITEKLGTKQMPEQVQFRFKDTRDGKAPLPHAVKLAPPVKVDSPPPQPQAPTERSNPIEQNK